MFDTKAFIGFITLAAVLPVIAQETSQAGLIWDKVNTSHCHLVSQLAINDF